MVLTQSTLIQVRVDDNFKKEADKLFAELGFDTPTAIRIFLKRALDYKGIPFDVAIPRGNKQLLKARRPDFKFGSMSGKVRMSDDFDAPLEDFEE